MTYRYDAAGRLVEADGRAAGRRRYDVDDARRVVAVTDADGVVEARNTYDDEGRVIGQLSPHGRRSPVPLPAGRVTIVDDDAGGPTNTYVHDDDGRLIGRRRRARRRAGQAVRPLGQPGGRHRTQRRHDPAGVGRRGRGSLRRVQPDGIVVPFAYDDRDRVAEVVGVDGRRHPLPLRRRRAHPGPRSSTPRAASPA